MVQNSPNSVLLSWTPSSNANGYMINYARSCGDNNQHLINGGNINKLNVTTLEDGRMYTISIVAISNGFPSESVKETVTLMGANYGKKFI